MPNDLDCIFWIKSPPRVSFEDGMFHICFDLGKHATIEIVMSPNNFLKMRQAAGKVVDQFHEKGRVEALRTH